MQQKIKTAGFTIVELLVVIVVIGILATLLIVGGNSYFHKTADSATQSSLEGASRKLDAYKLKNGIYNKDALASFKSEDNVTVDESDIGNKTYCLKATSMKYDDITYYVDNKGDVSQTSCSTPTPPPPPADPPPPPAPTNNCPNNGYHSKPDGYGIYVANHQSYNFGPNTVGVCGMPGDVVAITIKCDTTHRGNYAAGDGYPSTDDAIHRNQDVAGNTYNSSIGNVTVNSSHEGFKGFQATPSYGPFIDPSNYAVVCQAYGHDNTKGKTLTNNSGDNQDDRFFYDKNGQ